MNIDKVGGEGEKYYDQPIEPQGEINKVIPFEIFERILSNLDGMDFQQANLVGRLWSVGAIDTAKQKELAIIKGFTQFLCESLPKDSYADQKKALINICFDTKVLGGVNLIEIKYSIEGMKENLLIIVKDLKDDDLKDLEAKSQNERKPLFFENFFELAKIYKQLDQVNKMPNGLQKRYALRDVSHALMQIGDFEKSIEVANLIPDELENGYALRDISQALIEIGNFEKAIEAANFIPVERKKGYALANISKALIQIGNFEKAIEVANMIPDEIQRGDALRDISKALKKRAG